MHRAFIKFVSFVAVVIIVLSGLMISKAYSSGVRYNEADGIYWITGTYDDLTDEEKEEHNYSKSYTSRVTHLKLKHVIAIIRFT